MGTGSKIFLVILVILLVLVIIIPVALYMAGFQNFTSPRGTGVGTTAQPEVVLLRSSDNGATWQHAGVSAPGAPPFPAGINDILFHPENNEVMFAGTHRGGLWQSEDGGKTWRQIQDKNNVFKTISDVFGIAISPANPAVIYVAAFQDNRGRVLRSQDSGNSFLEVYQVSANTFGVFDLWVSPANSNHVRIATGQGGLLESSNAGRTWHVLEWFGEPLARLAVNEAYHSEMIVITSRGRIWKTTDGGNTWKDLGPALRKVMQERGRTTANPLGSFFGSPADRSQSGSLPPISLGGTITAFTPGPYAFTALYIGSRSGLFRSINAGLSWERVDFLIPPRERPASVIAIHPRSSNTLFVGSGAELYRSDDGGVNWRVQTLPARANMQQFFIHPNRPDIMFAVF